MTTTNATYEKEVNWTEKIVDDANVIFKATSYYKKIATHITAAKAGAVKIKFIRKQEGPSFGFFSMNPFSIRALLVITICMAKGGSNTNTYAQLDDLGAVVVDKDEVLRGALEYAKAWEQAHPGKPATITQKGLGKIAWSWFETLTATQKHEIVKSSPYLIEIATLSGIAINTDALAAKFCDFMSTYSLSAALIKAERDAVWTTVTGLKTRNKGLQIFLLQQLVKDFFNEVRSQPVNTARLNYPSANEFKYEINKKASFYFGYNMIQSKRFDSFSMPEILNKDEAVAAANKADAEVRTQRRMQSKESSITGFNKYEGSIEVSRNYLLEIVKLAISNSALTTPEEVITEITQLTAKTKGKKILDEKEKGKLDALL